MLGQTNNVPIRCNDCNHLYYVEPDKANDPCQVCKSTKTEQISEMEAMSLFRDAMGKSMNPA